MWYIIIWIIFTKYINTKPTQEHDGVFKCGKCKSTHEENLQMYNITLSHIYEKAFGKDIIEDKRINIKHGKC